MPYSLTRNFPFGKIKQNHSKLNKTERNGKGEKQKMKKKILAALTAGILTTGLMTGTVFAADPEGRGLCIYCCQPQQFHGGDPEGFQ